MRAFKMVFNQLYPSHFSQEFNVALRILGLPKDLKPSYLKELVGADIKVVQANLVPGEAALQDDYKMLKDEKYAYYLDKVAGVIQFEDRVECLKAFLRLQESYVANKGEHMKLLLQF
jgi:hypothetical protein